MTCGRRPPGCGVRRYIQPGSQPKGIRRRMSPGPDSAHPMSHMHAEILQQPAALQATIDALLPRAAEAGELARSTRQVLFIAPKRLPCRSACPPRCFTAIWLPVQSRGRWSDLPSGRRLKQVFCNAKRTGGGYQENGWGNHADGQNSPPIAAPEIFQTQEYQERGKYSAKVVWLNPETGGLQKESS